MNIYTYYFGGKKMDTVYRSFDGVYFDDELQCLTYEMNLKARNNEKENNILFFDENGEVVKYDAKNDDFFENVEYVYIKNQDGISVAREISDFFNIMLPSETGLSFWKEGANGPYGSYVNVETYIQKTEKFLHVTTELKEKIRNGKIDFN